MFLIKNSLNLYQNSKYSIGYLNLKLLMNRDTKKYSAKLLFTGNINPQDVRHVAPKIAEENIQRLKYLGLLSFFIWCIMLICAIFVDYMRSNSPYYLLALIGSSISLYLVKFSRNSKLVLQLGISILVGSLLIFGMAVGLMPQGNATAYIALLFCIPQLFCFRPIRIVEIVLLPNLIFIPLCIHFKSGIQLQDDIINILSFGFVALIIALMTSKSRVNELILKSKLNDAMLAEERRNRKLEQMVFIDELTGLGNFPAYKASCESVSDQGVKVPIGVLYADLNRLKYINDKFGHDAGDKYICDFAELLKKTFPDYQCYRISGDEFKVLCLDGNLERFANLVNTFEKQIKSQEIPCASLGYSSGLTNRIEELASIAETRMYEDKRAFYNQFPRFIR